MRTSLFLLFIGSFVAAAQAEEKWHDVLSTAAIQMSEASVVSVEPSSIGTVTPAVESVISSSNAIGRSIIVANLQSIEKSEAMVSTITLETYWQKVFADAGHPELYDRSTNDIQVALEAGLSPYLRGEVITAPAFAKAALAALANHP